MDEMAKSPTGVPQRRRALFWVVCGLSGVVVLVGAAVLAPCMVGAKPTAEKNACINNLRMLDGAKDQWSLENRAVVNLSDVQVYLKAEPKVSGRRRLLSGVGRRGSEVHALGEAAPVVRANDL